MTIYRAEFFTAADYAARDFVAATPEDALQLARRFYDEDLGELDFRSYDDNAGLDQIQIWDNERGTLASWESDDYRLRRVAPELLTALIKSEQRINQLCDLVNTLSNRLKLGDKSQKRTLQRLCARRHCQSQKQGVLMLLTNKLRAVYSRSVHGNVIAIIDHDGPRSVTNDADNVIADLTACFDLSRYQVIYRDTRGIWDQILVDRTGHFAGFSSLNERELAAALGKVTRH
jgi:hypothetical protein